MADLLTGLSLVEGLNRLFPALLVLLLLFAILQSFKVFGEKSATINALIAVVVAGLVLISPQISYLLSFMAPWFVVLFFFIIFILIAFKAMGVSDGQILGVMRQYRMIAWLIVFAGIAIAAVGLGNIMGQDLLEGRGSTESSFTYTENADGTYIAPDGNIVAELPPGAIIQSDYNDNLTTYIFHPKVLGFILIGLIAMFTVHFMTRNITA